MRCSCSSLSLESVPFHGATGRFASHIPNRNIQWFRATIYGPVYAKCRICTIHVYNLHCRQLNLTAEKGDEKKGNRENNEKRNRCFRPEASALIIFTHHTIPGHHLGIRFRLNAVFFNGDVCIVFLGFLLIRIFLYS